MTTPLAATRPLTITLLGNDAPQNWNTLTAPITERIEGDFFDKRLAHFREQNKSHSEYAVGLIPIIGNIGMGIKAWIDEYQMESYRATNVERSENEVTKKIFDALIVDRRFTKWNELLKLVSWILIGLGITLLGMNTEILDASLLFTGGLVGQFVAAGIYIWHHKTLKPAIEVASEECTKAVTGVSQG